MKMKKVNKKGFSLLELILVLSVGTAITYIKFQDMRNEQNFMKASAAGEQIQKIGYAVNNYISLRYDKLSTLTPSTSQSSDPGPRTCSGNTCTITIQTLKNEGILPASFVDVNAFKSPHTIVINRTGTSPNYVIDGLITTASAWIESGNNPRYDLLGYAMQKAGIDSGMTKSNIKVDGYNGNWSEKSSSFNNITKAGQLAFRVGYNSSLYSAYLRRDGTLPMTGNLNMGGNDINNAKDITASGNGNFKGNVTAGNWVTAHNQNGHFIKMGGDGDGNFDVILDATTPVKDMSFFPSDAKTKFGYNFRGDLKVSNPDGKNTGVKMDGTTGNITASGNINAGNWVTAHNGYGDAMHIGGDAAGNDYEIKLSASKPLTLWGHNGKNSLPSTDTRLHVWGSQSIKGNLSVGKGYDNKTNGQITASGNITTGGFIQINGIATVDAACSPNGLQGRNKEGSIVSCVNGKWKNGLGVKIFKSKTIYAHSGNPNLNIGVHNYCALSKAYYDYNNWRGCTVNMNKNGSWTLQAVKVGNGEATCEATCF